MRITVGKHSGFCKGVQRAIELSLNSTKNEGSSVYTYGELIHNALMVKKLDSYGVKVLNDLSVLTDTDTVIIRTHGISESEYNVLKNSGANIIDATCPFVSNIHNKVAEYSKNGYSIIVIGHKDHPEVQGILGWCKDAVVVKSKDEIDLSKNEKYYVVVQTTFDYQEYQSIADYIKILSKKLNKSVVIFNSICYTTKERQAEAVEIASHSDCVLVVGDKNSSNTMRLLHLAKQYAPSVFLVENVSDLSSVNIKNTANVGILAGASTPKELITEVFEVMTTVNKDVEVKLDDIATTSEVAEGATTVATEQTTEKKSTSAMTMEEAMRSNKYAPRSYREGKRLSAIVESADESGITVSILGGGKNDSGFVAADEAELDDVKYEPSNYVHGQEIDVVIITKTDSKQKSINLSKKAYDAIKVDDEKVAGILAGETFEMKVEREVKGGLTGKIGTYVVFIPASELKDRYVSNLGEYVGKTLKLKQAPPRPAKAEEETAVDEEGKERRRSNKRIVASHKIVVAEERAAQTEEFLSSIEINQIVEGKVKRFSTIGAFVSVNGYDCLAHISQLAYHHIADPSEVLEIGKTYEFVVLSIDHENGHVSLGYKQLQSKRYEAIKEKYEIGSVVKGKVVRVKKFAAFVNLEDGIEGRIHISQIGHEWVGDINQAIQVGQEIEAKVLAFENDDITLSIKELLPAPEVAEVVENSDAEEQADGAETKKSTRKVAADKGEKKTRRPRRDDSADGEQREYVSSVSGATMADLFKGLDLDFDKK